ncbi:MAG: potassium-transporting ATPase subunit KdpC [Syntrophorhabdus sp.]|nr:potassium-transporting ATPase subunit KdpC [Syntrophorhabdus sp.]
MKECMRALCVFIVITILTGLAYPFLITRVAGLLFPRQANGSLVIVDGKTIGSELIGQKFTNPGYFHGRPSAVDNSASNSGGSNAGPSNTKFFEEVGRRIDKVRKDNGLTKVIPIPADLALASSSGLDPHISLEAAKLQVKRVAKVRGLSESEVQKLLQRYIELPLLGFLGQERVNVLRLNLALDELSTRYLRTSSHPPGD